ISRGSSWWSGLLSRRPLLSPLPRHRPPKGLSLGVERLEDRTAPASFGAVQSFAVGSGPRFVAVGDFNGDGKKDLAVANFGDNSASVLLGNGDGSFGPAVNSPVGMGPRCVAVGDFNGDGKADLVTANYGTDNVSVLLGGGGGSF